MLAGPNSFILLKTRKEIALRKSRTHLLAVTCLRSVSVGAITPLFLLVACNSDTTTEPPPTPPTPDPSPPGQVTDLAVVTADESSITLMWTAPGDDGDAGTATGYDIRYSTALLDDSSFESAPSATTVPQPLPAGATQQVRIEALSSGTTYNFGLKTEDDAAKVSLLSNVASGTTVAPPPPFSGQFPVTDARGIVATAGGEVLIVQKPVFNFCRVKRFDGAAVTDWTGGACGSANGAFDDPWGIAVDQSANVYVTDAGNARVQKFGPSGVFIAQWGGFGSSNGEFADPIRVAISSTNLVYVLDGGNRRVQRFSADGVYETQWTIPASGDGSAILRDLAVGPDNTVYVLIGNPQNQVEMFDPNGQILGSWGGLGSGVGEFNLPFGLAVDQGHRVYVTDEILHRVQMFTRAGDFLAMWGSTGAGAGEFSTPRGVSVATNGTVYVVDSGNDRVQFFSDL